jgi:oligopeptide/dipeptide ABC transporter ATP-binding protein
MKHGSPANHLSFPRTWESKRPRRSRSLNLSAPTMGPDLRRRIVAPGYRFRGCDKLGFAKSTGQPLVSCQFRNLQEKSRSPARFRSHQHLYPHASRAQLRSAPRAARGAGVLRTGARLRTRRRRALAEGSQVRRDAAPAPRDRRVSDMAAEIAARPRARGLAADPGRRRAGLGARRVGAGAGLNLLADLQAQRRLSYLFISHDIGTVAYLSHRVAVMYLGAIAEIGPAQDVLRRPLHPYTRLLLDAVPVAHPRLRARRREVLRGEPPGAAGPGGRCRFAPRRPMAAERCRTEEPRPRTLGPGRLVACHFGHFAEAMAEAPLGVLQ